MGKKSRRRSGRVVMWEIVLIVDVVVGAGGESVGVMRRKRSQLLLLLLPGDGVGALLNRDGRRKKRIRIRHGRVVALIGG